MLFHTYQFFLFFSIVIAVYFLIPQRTFRHALLLIASYYFYMVWAPEYAILLLGSTIVDYCAGLIIGRTQSKATKRTALGASLLINLGVLFTFKYFNFFIENTQRLAEALGVTLGPMTLEVLLPIGISFYTFQTLSYTIDVYRGKIAPEKNLLRFALFVAFFPQMVAGPIERAKHLLPQFKKDHSFDYDRIVDGFKRIAWGLFKKMVIADNVAMYVDRVFEQPESYSIAAIVVAVYFFAIQIYCDFSGYSDIAIGTAKVLGYDIMENFKLPYFARNIREFWRRWHISLYTWFRDYVYIPLGGSRVTTSRWYFNILLVFLITGIWHGAEWTFVLWGVFHGIAIVLSSATEKRRERWAKLFNIDKYPALQKVWQVLITFHIVAASWLLFRLQELGDLAVIWEQLVVGGGISWLRVVPRHMLALFVGVTALLFVIQMLQRKREIRTVVKGLPAWVRMPAYVAFIALIVLFGQMNAQDFIYFQF